MWDLRKLPKKLKKLNIKKELFMRLLIIFISTIVIASSAFAQDSITVDLDDWKFIQKTTQELDSALVECDTLSVMYEQRMSLFQITTAKDEQLEMREEQIALLNHKINKQKMEIWMERGGGLLLIVAALLLLK